MKILVVSRGFPTKRYPLNGIFEWDQAKALKEYGHEVIFVAIDLRSIRRKRKFGLSVFEQDGIKVYNYNLPIGKMPYAIAKIFSWKAYSKVLKKIFKTQNIDIAHYHFGVGATAKAIKAKNKYGLNYIVTEHSSWINNNTITNSERKRLKELYANSVANIAVSPNFRDKLQKMYEEKFVYIPNIVDLQAFENVSKRPHDGFTFISVGNLIKSKGMDKLIEGFKIIHEKYSDSKLIIVGDGEEKQNLQSIVAREGLSDSVTFTGRKTREEIAEYMSVSDAFVLMSKSETFGVVYIEAMACGLPVIATKCGGPEGFVDDTNGILVEVDNINQLVNAMEYMISDIAEFNSENIKNYCKNNFSQQVVAGKITELLTKDGYKHQ